MCWLNSHRLLDWYELLVYWTLFNVSSVFIRQTKSENYQEKSKNKEYSF